MGWNRTAAIWGALDSESGVLYFYNEHYLAHDEPHVHSEAIKQRGEWIPGFIDPAAKGRSQRDGSQLIQLYREADLNVEPAMDTVEAGICACERMMFSGKLKAFTSLSNWYSEFRTYRRDREGKVVKENDHCMEAMRYLVMAGLIVCEGRLFQIQSPLTSMSQKRWKLDGWHDENTDTSRTLGQFADKSHAASY